MTTFVLMTLVRLDCGMNIVLFVIEITKEITP